jgi:hypothetical protein
VWMVVGLKVGNFGALYVCFFPLLCGLSLWCISGSGADCSNRELIVCLLISCYVWILIGGL